MKKSFIALSLMLVCLLLAGCSSTTGAATGSSSAPTAQPTAAASVNLPKLMDDIAAKVTLNDAMVDLTLDQLTALYGISSAEVDQFAGKLVSISIVADEIVMVKAKDETAAASVKTKFEARYQAKLAEMKDYLPNEYAKLEKCGVISSGNYVALFVADNAADMTALWNEALGL